MSNRTALLVATMSAALVVAGCATSGRSVARGDRHVITAEQIAEADRGTAFDIVQRMRPHFLQQRGNTSLSSAAPVYPSVYVDGMHRGSIRELRQVPGSAVARIEYISAADATTRWGTGHPVGVIAVETRRR